MKPDRTVVTLSILLIASLSLALPAACSSDNGANADGGGGHGGATAAGSGGGGSGGTAWHAGAALRARGDRWVRRRCRRRPIPARARARACTAAQLCNSCPPSAPLCPGAIAYCDASGACVIGAAPVCP